MRPADRPRAASPRPTPARRISAAALAVVALAAPVSAAARRGALVPDQAKVQVAGGLGLVAAGAGYAFAGRRLELDVLVGWVPPPFAGVQLFSLNAKLTWLPWTARLSERWRLRPFTAGLVLSYALGDRFFLTNPGKYPTSDYYPIPTALRAGVALGGTLGRAVGRRSTEVAVYWELGAWDIPLALWIQNPRTVRASDVISLALGVRASF
jgi:hypothetical protein